MYPKNRSIEYVGVIAFLKKLVETQYRKCCHHYRLECYGHLVHHVLVVRNDLLHRYNKECAANHDSNDPEHFGLKDHIIEKRNGECFDNEIDIDERDVP